jgi:peptide/nickel transport system permease protein
MPEFWFAILLQIALYGRLGWFPAGGRIDRDIEPPTQITGLYTVDSLLTLNFDAFVSSAYHLILPVTALALARVAVVARLTRSGMLEVLSADYIRTARAKGLRERIVVYRHALKNASLPVLTQIGNQFGFLLGGTILIEAVFQWPGVGRYAVSAITRVDFNPIIGVALLGSLTFVLVNLLVDILYKFFDPRIRY